MSLEIYTPQPPLSEYVHMLWYWEGYHPPHPRERILPHGMMELTFNLCAEPLNVHYPPDHANHTIQGAMVSGARSEYYVIDTVQPASILSVLFKPGAALPFFGTSGKTMHNLHIPLDALWGTSAHDLFHQLLEPSTTQHRFHVLEYALLARLQSAKDRHYAVNYALHLLPQGISVSQAVDEIGISATRFIQVFREDIGVTPKLYSRLLRFQSALRHIAGNPSPNWTDIALTCGYYDQAHFINDFQHFAGITPTQYAPQDPEHRSNLPYFDEV